ncbi:Hypothetical protein, putative [Bodo saltans]|uniref:Uncharacterized protein n=1 Tax=Bodo saltans TaxID=75058 RepID=A0A0S4J864_BODSA|nr:Hypothetical protein, putative [Bodo saltans]|eukprot:CUG85452.1 Hypothetical protein, putative [Bodo saltans]
MDLARAFLPNAKEAGFDPFPMAVKDRDTATTLSPISAFQRFSRCCRAAMNRTIVGFCDPSLYQCKDEAALYFSALSGDKSAALSLGALQRQEFDPSALPWKSKPAYLAHLESQKRLGTTAAHGQSLTGP